MKLGYVHVDGVGFGVLFSTRESPSVNRFFSIHPKQIHPPLCVEFAESSNGVDMCRMCRICIVTGCAVRDLPPSLFRVSDLFHPFLFLGVRFCSVHSFFRVSDVSDFAEWT